MRKFTLKIMMQMYSCHIHTFTENLPNPPRNRTNAEKQVLSNAESTIIIVSVVHLLYPKNSFTDSCIVLINSKCIHGFNMAFSFVKNLEQIKDRMGG